MSPSRYPTATDRGIQSKVVTASWDGLIKLWVSRLESERVHQLTPSCRTEFCSYHLLNDIM